MKIRLGALIIPAVLITLGVALGKYGLTQVEHGIASESWSDADAKVTKFGFKKSRRTSGRRGKGGGGNAPPVVFIEYIYEVGGHEYVGSRAGYGAVTGGEFRKRPYKGKVIPIKYNPENVAESVWITGVIKSAKTASYCGLGLVLVGIFVLIIGLRGKRGR